MELFASIFSVVLVVWFLFFIFGLKFDIMYDGWLPFVSVLTLGTMWICQLIADPMSEQVSYLLLTGVLGCAIAALFYLHRMISVVRNNRREVAECRRSAEEHRIALEIKRQISAEQIRAREEQGRPPLALVPRPVDEYERLVRLYEGVKNGAEASLSAFERCSCVFAEPGKWALGFDPADVYAALVSIRDASADYWQRGDLVLGKYKRSVEFLFQVRMKLCQRHSFKDDGVSVVFIAMNHFGDCLSIVERRLLAAVQAEEKFSRRR